MINVTLNDIFIYIMGLHLIGGGIRVNRPIARNNKCFIHKAVSLWEGIKLTVLNKKYQTMEKPMY